MALISGVRSIRVKIMGEARSTTGIARSLTPTDSSREVLRKLFSETAMSVPALEYRRNHSCSKDREKPTKDTNAPIAIAIPPSVSKVLRRLRHKFFQAKPVKDNCETMLIG